MLDAAALFAGCMLLVLPLLFRLEMNEPVHTRRLNTSIFQNVVDQFDTIKPYVSSSI